MSTYIVRAPARRLNADQKARAAHMLTTLHSELTGTKPWFVQVIFAETEPDGIFLGGKHLSGDILFIHGHARAGRSATERAALIREIVPRAMDIAGMPRHAIWVYLSELPARAVAEYGHISPEPGAEEEWLAALSEEERARVEGRPAD
jgi:phenylpyruvate tautomerase PptA (4-oxalocrotonate tautomerase family)